MTLPEIVSREEWTAARTALLAEEKRLTRARDRLNAQRRRLPMVEVTEDYVFEGPEGKASLPDLFAGHAQLIVGAIYTAAAAITYAIFWAMGRSSASAGAPLLTAPREMQLAMLIEAVMLGYSLARKGERAP